MDGRKRAAQASLDLIRAARGAPPPRYPSAVAIVLGSMRLSTDPARRDGAERTLAEAIAAGISALDTARAYALTDEDLGHHERLVAGAIAGAGAEGIRVVTKCGMTRPDGRWVPDGRAKTIEAHALASAEALAPARIDTLLLHAPDPRTDLATSVRALARLRDRGLARRIGLCNVTRRELREALAIASIDVVQIALGAHDDAAARGGLLSLAAERGIEVMAYGVLGGEKRAARTLRDRELSRIAGAHGASPASVIASYLARVHPGITCVVGASRPETARATAEMREVSLTDEELARLDARFPGLGHTRAPPEKPPPDSPREVVVIMGIPGAGKSTHAVELAGYARLNRDERGGTLRGITKELDARLAAGGERFVLDNTYLTRALRADVVRVAHTHGARVRCIYMDTPLARAERNVAARLLARHGALLGGQALARAAKTDAGTFAPLTLHRAARALEPPEDDEGFAEIVRVPFVARPEPYEGGGRVVAVERVLSRDLVVLEEGLTRATALAGPWLVYAWRPRADASEAERAIRAALVAAGVPEAELHVAICTHGDGPPTCWCRPPLPGLALSLAEDARVSLGASTWLAPASHRAMADRLGARWVD